MEREVREGAEAALHALLVDGSPVVGADNIPAIVTVGWRRWNSFERRKGSQTSGHELRVEDLAKGLLDRLERDPSLAGPLIEDYRHLARVLAGAFSPSQ